jgi:DNA repair exonuclease SbcCD ATPase subunit
MEEKGKALDEKRSELETYALLKDQIFHKKGVAMYAINQLLPELEIETSQNLIDLTDGRFTRVNLKTHEAKREYGVRIEVEGVDGDWHDVAEFSGGERTQINAALRFAIAKQLAGLPQVGRSYGRMKTLFIDEGDLGSLDTETNRDLFIHKLFEMGEFFDRVVLITHLGEVADKFPGKVRVQMTPKQESRIEVVS